MISSCVLDSKRDDKRLVRLGFFAFHLSPRSAEPLYLLFLRFIKTVLIG